MKTNYASTVIVSGIMLFCCGCTKNNTSAPIVNKLTGKTLDTTFTITPIAASIVGKWYVNKERVQVLNTSTGAITDTTYSGSSFNSDSYYQFNSDSTSTFTQGTIFFTSSSILVNGSDQTVSRMVLFYNVTNSRLTLRYKYPFPVPSNYYGGPYTLTIVQLDTANLVLHGINSTVNGSQKTVMDVYLTRAQ